MDTDTIDFRLKMTNLILPSGHQIDCFLSVLLHSSTIYELEIILLFEMEYLFLRLVLLIL